MKKAVKYFVSIFLTFAVMICAAAPVSAVQPRFSYTNSVTVRLVFSGTTAYCTASVRGYDSVTSITDGHLVLEDSKGTVVGEWKNLSSSSQNLDVSKTVSDLNEGETYTLTFSAKVIANNGSETVSNYVSKTCK